MGQSQSADGGNGDPHRREHDEANGKRDFYEILGVEPLATTEHLKKAYRKKALELHPDKNYGNIEQCTALFAEVQAAYEVLSDPQERAWYDSNRDAILYSKDNPRGDQHSYNSKVTGTEDILNAMINFNPRTEFSDDSSGFFGGVREIFERLAQEELNACIMDGLESVNYPSFGFKDDDLDSIRPFYGVWSTFSTKKSFAWKDTYKYSEAPDRRVRRLMEKENKRLRDEAIREFNDAQSRMNLNVRDCYGILLPCGCSLAGGIGARLGEYSVPEWAQREQLEEEMFSATSESEQDHFECVVCRKTFKSEKQFEAHERSKKHIKAVRQLRYEMKVEDDHVQINTSESQEGVVCGPEFDTTTARETDTADNLQKETLQCEDIGENATMDNEGTEFSCNSDTPEQPPTIKHPLGESHDSAVDQVGASFANSSIADARPTESTVRKAGKAKQKRAKKAIKTEGQNGNLACGTCGRSFMSRNKLFCHLKEESHGIPSSQVNEKH
ncbi:J protein type 1 [Coccidioides immitis RMSCC 3703]|uniref:J protein type 1 n=1 Tax=Coccidioides immitis RMSCC 3703 TaxID=454286 RepID=A0A0J8R8T5_COCIT|nr:J protein type 1 [Coccidioides immitis RMSCC 3703]